MKQYSAEMRQYLDEMRRYENWRYGNGEEKESQPIPNTGDAGGHRKSQTRRNEYGAYWRVLGTSQGSKLWACHYLIDMGKSRGCEPGVGCVRKAARISRRRRYTQHGMEEVVAHEY